MFTAIATSQQRIRLHRLQGAVIASTGAYIARAQGGLLQDQRRTEAVGAPDAQGMFPSPMVPRDIATLEGRWPDCAWTVAEVGWAFSGTSPYPRQGVARWDAERGQWVEQPGISSVHGWADGVLAGGADGTNRWVDGSDRPLPPVLVQGLLNSTHMPFHKVSKSGDVIAKVQGSPTLEPGWWIFPRGECEGERFAWPPELDESSISLSIGHAPYDLIAEGELKSGEPFRAYRVEGRWQPLPPFPTKNKWEQLDVRVTPSGELLMISFHRLSSFSICRLVRGDAWEPIPIFLYPNRCFPSDYTFVAGEEGELWLALDFGIGHKNDVILYHARS
ncbi:hypothetical protein [Sorangium sp. So ce590]|uniref:hypothetical protein n=1 Tax=unclassified Sorangium TaxID=2621164 RepID=UPI003F60F502